MQSRVNSPEILFYHNFFFERLRFAVDEVEGAYDVVVLDTPPSLGFLTFGAIYAANRPPRPSPRIPPMLDVMSMSLLLSHP